MTKRKSPQSSGLDAGERSARAQELVVEGARLLSARRAGEAALRLRQAWDLDPQNIAAAINLGGAYILQGKHHLAVPPLEAASKAEPGNPMVWSNLAAAHLGKLPFSTPARQELAIAAYERALEADPRTPHVHYNLGLIYLEREDMLRAAAHFYSALETDPNDHDARQWLDRIRSGESKGGEPQG